MYLELVIKRVANVNQMQYKGHTHNLRSTDIIEPNATTFATLVRGFSVLGLLDKAVSNYQQMTRHYGFDPDVLTINALLQCCADIKSSSTSEKAKYAKSIVEKLLIELDTYRLPVNEETQSLLRSLCVSSARIESFRYKSSTICSQYGNSGNGKNNYRKGNKGG